jgi:hypothetical protein
MFLLLLLLTGCCIIFCRRYVTIHLVCSCGLTHTHHLLLLLLLLLLTVTLLLWHIKPWLLLLLFSCYSCCRPVACSCLATSLTTVLLCTGHEVADAHLFATTTTTSSNSSSSSSCDPLAPTAAAIVGLLAVGGYSRCCCYC